jgi:hypothetical protein
MYYLYYLALLLLKHLKVLLYMLPITHFLLRFFTVHNTTQRSYVCIIGFSLWVK